MVQSNDNVIDASNKITVWTLHNINWMEAYHRKQLHTWGYVLACLKPVDLWTDSYHQGAHKPSIDFGPASQLKSFLNCQPLMYVCKIVIAGILVCTPNSNLILQKQSYPNTKCPKNDQTSGDDNLRKED